LNDSHIVPRINDGGTLKCVSEKYIVGKEDWIHLP
jgi:hypothetical protein